MSSILLETVRASLQPYLAARARLLVAVSGGRDSVALLDLLRQLPYRLVVAHVDHRLRPASRADARFVRELATSYDLPYKEVVVEVRQAAKKSKQGIEETARKIRYKSFLRIAREQACDAVITAHHANDQAETVLLNFLRGAGPTGLAGMAPARLMEDQKTQLVRPLLSMERGSIEAYVKQNRLPFRDDASNRSLDFTRNRIRHVTLPRLTRDFPGLPQRLLQTANIFHFEELFWREILHPYLAKSVRKNGKMTTIDLRRLFGYHKALGRRLLRAALPGLSFGDLERVFALADSSVRASRVVLSGGRSLLKSKDKLRIPTAASRLPQLRVAADSTHKRNV